MKKSLVEQLNRIHTLTYGHQVTEGFLDKLLGKKDKETKVDDPKKADFVTDDVKQFFDTLESINSELKEQPYGSREYQKNVETVQIALTLLGYDLPQYGVDGKYGTETAAAVAKFKRDNNIEDSQVTSESNKTLLGQLINELELVQLDDTSYSNVKFDNDATRYDEVNKALLDDLQRAAEAAGLTLTVTTAKSGHSDTTIRGTRSRHADRIAVDIAILDGMGAGGATNPNNGNPKFRELGNRLKDALVQLGYVWNTESGNDKAVLWQTNTGGNHYNHLHVSNKSGASDAELQRISGGSGSVVTLEMVKVLVEKLKEKGVTSEELKKLTDTVSGGGPINLTGNWVEITKEMLRKNEGFLPTAKWDENAYRGGYGTDKKIENGVLTTADANTTWTRQEAEETMEYELKNSYGPIVARQLGMGNWNKLTDPQKAALVSLGYNVGPYYLTARGYGRKIKSAIESGDMQAAADAIAQGPVTGAGSGRVYTALQRRRKEESQIFMA